MTAPRHHLDPTVKEHFDRLIYDLREDLSGLVNHPVYGMVADPKAQRIFMASHVFAVWDFMSLLKALQRGLTCTTVPWTPVRDTESARLVNEIVLGEETDEIYPGVYVSHFELYLDAMEECGADRGPIDGFLAALRAGDPVSEALAPQTLPQGTRDFVAHTLDTAALPVHRVAASFLLGRENVIPSMFLSLLSFHSGVEERQISVPRLRARGYAVKLARWLERRYSPREVQLPAGPRHGDAFKVYLERHVEVDAESHGPMGERLLMRLCGRDEALWDEATETARAALRARRAMWDGVMEAIQEARGARSRSEAARRASRA